MPQNVKYGKEISKDEAAVILERNKKMKRELTEIVTAVVKYKGDDEVIRFYTCGFNGFIFSKELVLRYFGIPVPAQKQYDSKEKAAKQSDEGDAPASLTETADVIIVLTGAHPKNDNPFKKGDPTVMIVGCKEEQVMKDGRLLETRFVSLDIPNPFSEHPPLQLFETVPIEGPVQFILRNDE